MKKLLFFSWLLLALVSCERNEILDVDLPFKDLVVTHAFIEAGSSTVVVYLTRTTRVIGTSQPSTPTYEEDAQVYFDYNNTAYKLEYDSVAKLYTIDIGGPILAGSFCKVRVYKDGKEVYGETVLPQKVDIDLMLASKDTIDYNGLRTVRYNFRVKLKSGGSAPILIQPTMILQDSSSLPFSFIGSQRVTILKEGEEIEHSFIDGYGLIHAAVHIKAIAYHCDPVYAKYYNRFGMFSFGDLEGPFGEPYITSSNMSNGIGNIGSYTAVKTEVW